MVLIVDKAEKIQYMYNENGKKTFAVLPIELFEKMQNLYEELEAMNAYDKAKKMNSESVSLDAMIKDVESERRS